MMRRLVLALATTALLTACGGRGERVATLPAPGQAYTADGKVVQITRLKALPAPGGAASADAAAVPPQFQFLYGSGEALALSRQAFRALVSYATYRKAAGDSVVLAPNATLAAPSWTACAGKPRAAVFDADETVILNLGVEALAARDPAAPFDAAQWARWERTGAKAVVAAPGAIEAFAALRAANIAIIINTNRDASTAPGTVATLKAAGLGDFTPGTICSCARASTARTRAAPPLPSGIASSRWRAISSVISATCSVRSPRRRTGVAPPMRARSARCGAMAGSSCPIPSTAPG
nr:HAD family acid phosphatase [Sphingomonas melonis]